MKPVLVLLHLMISAAFLASCSSNPVSASGQTEGEALSKEQASAITERGTLSVHSRLVYRMLDLEETLDDSIDLALSVVEEDDTGTVSSLQRDLAIAESCYLIGDQTPDAETARGLFARAFLVAGKALRSHGSLESLFDPRHRLLGELYNRGLARFVVLSQAVEGHPSQWKGVRGAHPVDIVIESRPGDPDPASYDRFIPVDEVRFEGLANRHKRHGLGLPLIAVRDNRDGLKRKDPLRGPTIAEPLTLIARLNEREQVSLAFVDPRRTKTIPTRVGHTLSVAADFTTPLAWLIANSPLYTRENPSLFDPESFAPMTGMYLGEPYDPTKTPIILVHGLWSSPLTWTHLINEIWGDPALRDRYQIWFYAYPTGLPILANAARFREEIEATRRAVDPRGQDPASEGVVLIGHSMGGLLSKHMVKHVGTAIWDARATVPFDQINADPEERAFLKSVFFHEPLPFVDRVVFMATPHRGSSLAEGIVGAIGDALITLPKDVIERADRIIRKNPGVLRKNDALDDGPMSSIAGLRSDSPLLAALDQAPWKKGLPYHSVIGDEDAANHVGGSDGVVPYVSSHLDGARSERIVRSGHSVTADPAGIAEVRRILHLHLKQRSR